MLGLACAVALAAQAPPIVGDAQLDAYNFGVYKVNVETDDCIWVVTPYAGVKRRTLDGGRTLLFTGPPGDYSVGLVWILPTGEPKAANFPVKIRAPGTNPVPIPVPTPPPNPNPSPPPAPVPAARFPTLKGYVSGALPAVPSMADAIRKSQAGAVARTFREWADATRHPGEDLDALAKATGSAVKGALGSGRASWKAFLEGMEGEIDALLGSGAIASASDLRAAWVELADALEGR